MIAGSRVTTLAGSNDQGKVDGEGASARFACPSALALDERGRLLVADLNESCLRVVEASLTPPKRLAVEPVHKLELELCQDYGKLLEDTELADVTFAVDSQRFSAHRLVLAARSAYFSGLFKSGQGMREGGGSAAGEAIVLKEVRAGAFRVLLKYLYTGEVPEEEDCGEGLRAGEMAGVADRFQAAGLYEHCVGQFRGGLKVGNVVERLVQAHDSRLGVLEEVAMEYLKANAVAFQVCWCCVCVCVCVCVRVLSRMYFRVMVVPVGDADAAVREDGLGCREI
jgi:hypothetical protein